MTSIIAQPRQISVSGEFRH